MASPQGEGQKPGEQAPPPERRGGDSWGLAAVAGVVVLLVISLANWRDLQRLDRALGERLSPVVPRLDQGASRTEQGPDPDRVYAIQTEGSPFRGKADAPVTIAEFADFQ
jgi:hypothetical protein